MQHFINTSVLNILEDAVSCLNLPRLNIGLYPLIDYILSSTYLKITGSIEQKLLQISWFMGNHETDVRHLILKGKYETASSLKDKCDIYKKIISKILEKTGKELEIPHKDLYNNTLAQFDKIVHTNCFMMCRNNDVQEYEQLSKDITSRIKDTRYNFSGSNIQTCLGTITINQELKNINNTNIFGSSDQLLNCIYEKYIYTRRNALAHNLGSFPYINYFNKYSQKDQCFNNIFIHFLLLAYLDKIFIHLYKEYYKLVEK